MSYLKNKLKTNLAQYKRRKNKVNTIIKSQNPENRLIVSKSNKFVSAQVIDLNGKVVATISDKSTQGASKSENAKNAGLELAKKLKDAKVKSVVFDRNGHLYHGRIAAFADGLREGGIKL